MKVNIVLPLVVLGALGLAGCGQPPAASFSVNSQKLEPLIPEARAEIAKALVENFGNPNQLVAWEKFPIDYGKGDPKLPVDDDQHHDGWRLKEGRNLYMVQCVHCHGVAGDGHGPTAQFLNPLPRDYRLGIFKFKSTLGPLKPARSDLVHILKEGIPGTYMPSFVLLGDDKLGKIVDYVRWLSIRGNLEIRLAQELAALNATESGVAQEIANGEKGKLKREDVVNSTMAFVRQGAARIGDDKSPTN